MENLIDCHTHTSFSFDSETSPQEMIDTAVKKGLKVYAVTDHCDHCSDANYEHLGVDKLCWREDTDKAHAAIQELKNYYQDKVILLSGIELGEPMQNQPVADEIVKSDYDMVIGSLHNAAGHEDFCDIDFRKMTLHEIDCLMAAYFSELQDMLSWGKFDTLAHLTYPFRYMIAQDVPVGTSRYTDEIADILERVIRAGVALELNTSGLARRKGSDTGFTMPEQEHIRLYRELGGTLLTIGSDAHEPSHVGGGIIEGLQMAKKAGFPHITYFIKRQARQLEII